MNDLGRERLFFAVGLDEPTRDLLAAHVSAHTQAGLPGRPIAPQNWHITMRFLGWVTPLQRDGMLRVIDEAPLPGPFTARFSALGAFPRPRKAAVLWLGVDRGVEELEAMAIVCEAAARDHGFSPEERPFLPHITLSRIRPHQDVVQLLDGFPPFTVTMPVTKITLFQSHLRRGGAVYAPVDEVEL